MTMMDDKNKQFAVHEINARTLEGCMVETKTMQPAESCGSFPVHAFTFILCEKGKLHMNYDNVSYSINENDLFICLPDNSIHLSSETASHIRMLSVNQKFLQKHYLLQRILIPYMLQIKQMPLFHIPEMEFNQIRHMMLCIDWHLAKCTSSECIREAAIASVQMTLYNILQHIKSGNDKCIMSSCKREDELYLRFMTEVLLHYKKERRLDFYASKLCVSPKYLGTVLKNKTGKKAMELINSILIEDIKYQLRYTNDPIKAICDNFNFPNPSFFGKFFRMKVGQSPMGYREQFNNTLKN